MGHKGRTLGLVTATRPCFCGLRMTTSLPSSTRSSSSPRDARLIRSTVPGPWIGNELTTSSRGNHTASLSEMSLFACSRVRIPTTTNIVCTRARLPGRFARNPKQRAPTGHKSIDRRIITSDNDRRERLIQLVASQLKQAELGGTVGENADLFTDTNLRSAEKVMPGQIRQSRQSGFF